MSEVSKLTIVKFSSILHFRSEHHGSNFPAVLQTAPDKNGTNTHNYWVTLTPDKGNILRLLRQNPHIKKYILKSDCMVQSIQLHP